MIRRLVLALLLATVFPAAAQAQIEIDVHYCNWLEERSNIWDTAGTIPWRHGPTGRGYSSYDRDIVLAQIAEMQANGMKPLISWWGPIGSSGAVKGDAFLDFFLKIPSPLQMGILYEATDRLKSVTPDSEPPVYNMDDPDNRRVFAEDMAHLSQRYFRAYPQRFITVDGRPVVFVWISHAFIGDFESLSREVHAASPMWLVGSDFNAHRSFRPGLEKIVRGFDAVSAYGIYTPGDAVKYNGHITREFVDEYVVSTHAWDRWLAANAPGVKLMLPVQFAYDDYKIRHNPRLINTTVEEAEYFVARIAELIRGSCIIEPRVIGVSYNEHFEGTAIEPNDVHGDQWLRIIKTLSQQSSQKTVTCPAPQN